MPVTATAMMFGSMSIIGIPLIGGFWSKEGIIAETWAAYFHGETMMLGPALLILSYCRNDWFLYVQNVVYDICWRA